MALLAVPAVARGDYEISQSDTPDPAAAGAEVTYTVTVTNTGPIADPSVQMEVFSLSAGGADGVPNPYVRVDAPGECAIKPIGDYQTADCDLGSLGVGQTKQMTAVVQANVSMDHAAGLVRCDFGVQNECTAGPGATDYERTTVVVAPEVAGSAKVKLKGLPAGCIAADTTITAKARGDAVKEIKAKLIGRNVSERLGRATGRKLTFTIPADQLEQARMYDLNVNVVRKGMPGLKRTVSLQRC